MQDKVQQLKSRFCNTLPKYRGMVIHCLGQGETVSFPLFRNKVENKLLFTKQEMTKGIWEHILPFYCIKNCFQEI